MWLLTVPVISGGGDGETSDCVCVGCWLLVPMTFLCLHVLRKLGAKMLRDPVQIDNIMNLLLQGFG